MPDINQIIEEYNKNWFNLSLISNLKSWKEATVFMVKNNDEFLALKVYKVPKERTFKNNQAYLDGKFYKAKSERRAIKVKNVFSKKLIHENWIKREYFMLCKIYDLWWNIPKPFGFTKDSILMELIWNNDNIANKLQDKILDKKEAKAIFDKIIKNIEIFLKAWIVHWDLSAFNILYQNHEIFIIDFPQSLDIRNNPNSLDFLSRDIKNVCAYFKKYFEINEEKTVNKLWENYLVKS
jgi:RIO kinase 1